MGTPTQEYIGSHWDPVAQDYVQDYAPAQPVEKPPPPDAGPGWVYQAGTNSWVMKDQAKHDQWQAQQQLQATTATELQNRPTLDPRLATDTYAGATAARTPNVIAGQAAPTVDTTQTDQARVARDQALADQRRVLEKSLALGPDPVEQQALQQRFQERMVAGANTVAANARGGAGAVAAARGQVMNQTPALAGQAADAARNEELAMFQQRVSAAQTAGGIANTIGQTATASFGQEAQLATSTTGLALQTIDRVLADTGQQIQASESDKAQLGSMISDINHIGVDYAQLAVNVQENIFDQICQANNINAQIAGQIKAAAAANKKGPLDYLMGGLGAVEGAAKTAGTLGLFDGSGSSSPGQATSQAAGGSYNTASNQNFHV